MSSTVFQYVFIINVLIAGVMFSLFYAKYILPIPHPSFGLSFLVFSSFHFTIIDLFVNRLSFLQ